MFLRSLTAPRDKSGTFGCIDQGCSLVLCVNSAGDAQGNWRFSFAFGFLGRGHLRAMSSHSLIIHKYSFGWRTPRLTTPLFVGSNIYHYHFTSFLNFPSCLLFLASRCRRRPFSISAANTKYLSEIAVRISAQICIEIYYN